MSLSVRFRWAGILRALSRTRWRGPARPEDERGEGSPTRGLIFFGQFRNTQSSPIGARFSRIRSGALRVQMGCTPHLIASVFRSRLLNCGLSMSACDPLAESNHTPRHDRKVPCVDGSELAREIFTSQVLV